MSRRLFGTDGIRGIANHYPITPEAFIRLARAVSRTIILPNNRPTVLIGKDTRLSGYMLESSLMSGFISMGVDVILVGPLPTPAVAMLTRSLRADLGVMITASHNPYSDNGIKFFDKTGHKLTDEQELIIEDYFFDHDELPAIPLNRLGKARRLEDASGRYVEFVKNSFPRSLNLKGKKIVLDCAHGAAYKIAPAVFWELGADVVELNTDPDGMNINLNCGATHPESLQQAVIHHKADMGIAFDGDADRMVMVDHTGAVVEGDQILSLIAKYWHKTGFLAENTLVTTIMSSMALEQHLNQHGIQLQRTHVGDRYVSELMRQKGYSLGGETSGHIIIGGFATTGDGILSSLQVIASLLEEKEILHLASRQFTPIPQILRNIKISNAKTLLSDGHVQQCIRHFESQLGNEGRLIIRASGTEPLLRVMIEGPNEIMLSHVMAELEIALDRAQQSEAS